ncbi:hypothetical protein D3C81_1890710 [compost metagenome]
MPIVKSVLPNKVSTEAFAFLKDSITTSAVSSPSFAILRSSPIFTFSPVAIAFNRPGACSEIELNSSPSNTPEAKA